MYPNGIPTARHRIQVTVDPELDQALRRAASLVGARGQAGIIRELALRGAQAAIDEEAERRWAVDYLLHEELDLTSLLDIDEQRRARLP